MTQSENIPIGVVHGIERTHHVFWLGDDLAMIDHYEFASSRSGGFIDEEDVLDQARDVVAGWDEDAL